MMLVHFLHLCRVFHPVRLVLANLVIPVDHALPAALEGLQDRLDLVLPALLWKYTSTSQ